VKVKLRMFRIVVLVYVILVCGFAVRARACDCVPPCNGCQVCEAGGCVNDCNEDDCESCVDDSCQVCDGDPNQVCCDGNCCDTDACEECIDGNCVTIDVNSVTVDANSVCVGCNVTFTVITDPCDYEDDVEWSAPGGDPNSGTGETFTTSWDTAGIHTATATLCDSNDSNDVTVVEVESLEPNDPNVTYAELDDEDDDPNTRSFAVCIVDPNDDPNVVTVIATPNPDVNEEDLPDSWSFTGGTDVNDFVHTVDRTVAAKTVLTCSCGTSSKTTTIYVVEVDIDIGLSDANELNPGKYINVNWDDDDGDGWTDNGMPPYATYTGDKDDPNIAGGDPNFRSFSVSISPNDLKTDFPDTKVMIAYSSANVNVWETASKRFVVDDSSSYVYSGKHYKIEDLPKDLYLEGHSGSSEFGDVNLVAVYMPCWAYDMIKVTVFEVDIQGRYGPGPQMDDNDAKHIISQSSSNMNGKISWDDANGDGNTGDNDPNCWFFGNCMECQGTVKPSGVGTEVEFDFKRMVERKWWKSEDGITWGNPQPPFKPAWTEDDLHERDEDNTPSSDDHIYQVDGPGLTWNDWPPRYVSYSANLKEWVKVDIDGTEYQCSNFLRWHAKISVWPKSGVPYTTTRSERTWLQKLDDDWIELKPD